MSTPQQNRRPGVGDQAVWFRSLAVLFEAGVPIVRILELLACQTPDPVLAVVSHRLADRISGGHRLSVAMKETEVFTPLHLGLVAVGETTGSLGKVFEYVGSYEEKRHALTMKLRSALVYPAFVFGGVLLMLLLVPPLLLSGLFEFIEGHGGELPWLSGLMRDICRVMGTPGFQVAALALAVAACAALPKLLRRPAVRERSLRIACALRPIRRVLLAHATALFAQGLWLQLQMGRPVQIALAQASRSVDNPLLEEATRQAVAGLEDGESLAAALDRAGLFPPVLIHLVTAGEESGQLCPMLKQVADFYEVELEHLLEVLTSLLEPLVMTVLGLRVGTMVIATMLPMVKVLDSL